MKNIKNEYKGFLDDIEKNIKNPEDLKYIQGRFAKFMDSILDNIENIMEYKTEEIEKVRKNQIALEKELDKMRNALENIERDIYDDEEYDFEIICPYCNNQFLIDSEDEKPEVVCPECKNIIELDWSGELEDDEDGCSGHCCGCSGCGDSDDEEEDM